MVFERNATMKMVIFPFGVQMRTYILSSRQLGMLVAMSMLSPSFA